MPPPLIPEAVETSRANTEKSQARRSPIAPKWPRLSEENDGMDSGEPRWT